MRFGRAPDRDFHDFIQRRFAEEVGVPYRLVVGSNNLEKSVFDQDLHFKMTGAGLCELNLDQHTVFFSGRSRDYEIGIDREHLDILKQYFPLWTFRY